MKRHLILWLAAWSFGRVSFAQTPDSLGYSEDVWETIMQSDTLNQDTTPFHYPKLLNAETVLENMFYPPMPKEGCISGLTVLRVLVNEEGKATLKVVMKKTPTFPLFEAEISRALDMMEFIPAKRNEKSLRIWMNIVINFEFRPEEYEWIIEIGIPDDELEWRSWQANK